VFNQFLGPPHALLITGIPEAIASTVTRLNDSALEGTTITSHRRIASSTVRVEPEEINGRNQFLCPELSGLNLLPRIQ
jgi:hypothetical protein